MENLEREVTKKVKADFERQFQMKKALEASQKQALEDSQQDVGPGIAPKVPNSTSNKLDSD